MKFEAGRIHFLGDVFAAVALVVLEERDDKRLYLHKSIEW